MAKRSNRTKYWRGQYTCDWVFFDYRQVGDECTKETSVKIRKWKGISEYKELLQNLFEGFCDWFPVVVHASLFVFLLVIMFLTLNFSIVTSIAVSFLLTAAVFGFLISMDI